MGFQCFAQTPNMDIYGAFLDIHVSSPYEIKQLCTRINALLVSQKEMQQFELRRADGDRLLVREHAMLDQIHFESTIDADRLVAVTTGTP
jgi:hypothetical protein